MTKKTYNNYVKLLANINKAGIIEEKSINRIKNALGKGASELDDLLYNEFKSEYNITQAQANKGGAYLVKKHLTTYGKQRKTSHIEKEFLELIRAIQEGERFTFTFNGYKQLTNGFWNYFAPIYTLIINGVSYAYFHFNGNDYGADTNYIGGAHFGIYCYDY